jgi:peptidoglycan glycosyltransferase
VVGWEGPAVLGTVLTHHLALSCLLAVLLGGVSSYAESATGEDAPAAIELDPELALALHGLPPGIRGDAPVAPSALAVEYTVDAALEAKVRAILARSRLDLAQVVVLDPATGEVFAYVASDPEAFPATRAYPTASLMKLVTAAAVLREKPGAARRSCRYLGSPYEFDAAQLAAPRTGGRLESFDDSLAISNNQCFARLAVRDVGRAALLAEIERVGMLAAPAAGHPAGSVDPVVDSLALGRLGSGLAGSFLSPLAAARLAAVLAHGELVEPHWVARVRDGQGALVAVPDFAAPQRVWEPGVADALRQSLRGVTERGTARRAFRNDKGKPLLGDVAVAGKTGTLSGEDPKGLYQWFVGVAPAEDPRIAIATLVVHEREDSTQRGGAGTNASHVAAQTLQALLCDREGCAADRVAPLFARASARRAESVAELAAQQAAREQARIAAEKVEPARLLSSSDIEFPRSLRRRQVEGEIVLAVSLAPSGDIAEIRVHESDVSKRFDQHVTEAVRGWKFAPSTRGGQPIASELRLRIPIQIR